jgi:hypothetical protein
MLEGGSGLWNQAMSGPLSLSVTSEIVFPTVSQTCSLWGASKDRELERCKEDLWGTDMEKIFCASSRIAKVMMGWSPSLGDTTLLVLLWGVSAFGGMPGASVLKWPVAVGA